MTYRTCTQPLERRCRRSGDASALGAVYAWSVFRTPLVHQVARFHFAGEPDLYQRPSSRSDGRLCRRIMDAAKGPAWLADGRTPLRPWTSAGKAFLDTPVGSLSDLRRNGRSGIGLSYIVPIATLSSGSLTAADSLPESSGRRVWRRSLAHSADCHAPHPVGWILHTFVWLGSIAMVLVMGSAC